MAMSLTMTSVLVLLSVVLLLLPGPSHQDDFLNCVNGMQSELGECDKAYGSKCEVYKEVIRCQLKKVCEKCNGEKKAKVDWGFKTDAECSLDGVPTSCE